MKNFRVVVNRVIRTAAAGGELAIFKNVLFREYFALFSDLSIGSSRVPSKKWGGNISLTTFRFDAPRLLINRSKCIVNTRHEANISHCPDASANLMPTNVIVHMRCAVILYMLFDVTRCRIIANESSHGGDVNNNFEIHCVMDNQLLWIFIGRSSAHYSIESGRSRKLGCRGGTPSIASDQRRLTGQSHAMGRCISVPL